MFAGTKGCSVEVFSDQKRNTEMRFVYNLNEGAGLRRIVTVEESTVEESKSLEHLNLD